MQRNPNSGGRNEKSYRLEIASLDDEASRTEGREARWKRCEICFIVVYAQLSAGGKARTRSGDRRRRRQSFSGLRRGNRGGRDGPLPSHCCRRDSEAGRATDSHVGHGFLLREHGGAGGEA